MSTPTTTQQDNLQSRLPDPSQFIPEVAEIAGAMFKATGNGSIPQTTRPPEKVAIAVAGFLYGSPAASPHCCRQAAGSSHFVVVRRIGRKRISIRSARHLHTVSIRSQRR